MSDLSDFERRPSPLADELSTEAPLRPSLDDLSPTASGSSGSSRSLTGPPIAEPPPPAVRRFDLRALGRRLGRYAAWGAALTVVFLVSVWVSLPTRAVAWRISHEARKAGFNVSVEDVSRIRPWGAATLEDVVWSFPPARADSTPVPFVVEELDIKFSLFKYLFFDKIDAEFEGTLDEGSFAGSFTESKEETQVSIKIDELPLYSLPKLQDAVNAPVRGLFALNVDIKAPQAEWSKASGTVDINCYSCTIGDGESKLYVPGAKKLKDGVTIPLLDLGTLEGRITVADGEATIEEFGTKSEDIEVKISGGITLKDPISTSQLDVVLKVFLAPQMLDQNERLRFAVAGARPEAKLDPPEEGWLGYVLEGNFKNRRFRAYKQKSRAERLRQKRDERRARSRDRSAQRAKARAERERAKEAADDKADDKAEAEAAEDERPTMVPEDRPEPDGEKQGGEVEVREAELGEAALGEAALGEAVEGEEPVDADGELVEIEEGGEEPAAETGEGGDGGEGDPSAPT